MNHDPTDKTQDDFKTSPILSLTVIAFPARSAIRSTLVHNRQGKDPLRHPELQTEFTGSQSAGSMYDGVRTQLAHNK